jgi:hypothetical protein
MFDRAASGARAARVRWNSLQRPPICRWSGGTAREVLRVPLGVMLSPVRERRHLAGSEERDEIPIWDPRPVSEDRLARSATTHRRLMI